MKIKALITALVLGSSSAAMAQPAFHISGGFKVSARSSFKVRDHRTNYVPTSGWHETTPVPAPAPLVPVSYRDRYADINAYEIPGNIGDWNYVQPALTRNGGSLVFEVNMWTGSIRFDGARFTGTYDAQLIYADGRTATLGINTGSYQTNIAPGVLQRIVLTPTSFGRAPQLYVSSANH